MIDDDIILIFSIRSKFFNRNSNVGGIRDEFINKFNIEVGNEISISPVI